ncbi:hypothetical protein [Streptomyces goshikiensis]|uniref:hypothetical protein n=1 Tax=Streptomyces goshikiensis TaxID=1942 RepID=UPI002E15E6A9|nr:hypothetical protein OG224_06910 [Streptomyces goshikiensis]
MSTELVKHGALSGASLPDMVRYAEHLANANLLPSQYRKQPANVLFAMEYGRTLGITPIAAITGIHVIEGKPSASAALISGLVRQAGHKLRVRTENGKAVASIIRSDDPDFEFRAEWDMDRARNAGLANKDVWKKYPQAMLKARAITEVARDACEEVLFGLHYTPEELDANVDSDGMPIEAPVTPLRRVQPGEPDQWATPAATVAAAVADLPPESLTPAGRDYLHEAKKAADADTVRLIWKDAQTEGARPEYLAQIAEVGKSKGSAPASPAADEIVDVEVVDDVAAAEQRLRATAAKVGLDTLDADFEQSYGLPIAQAGVQQLTEMTRILGGAA